MSGRGFDQRKSYRCPVDETHQEAELAVGRRRVPIRLYNESSGGFAALTDGEPGVTMGEVVGLCTCSGTFEVRVAHVSRVDTAPGEEQRSQPVFRLGLERLRDLASLSELHALRGRAPRHAGRARWIPTTTVGTLAVVLLLAAVAMNGLTMWCAAQTPARPALAGASIVPQAEGPAGAAGLGDAGLTPAQQTRLRSAASTVAIALQEIDAQWQRDPPAERARKQSALLDALRQEILQRLPAEQRAGRSGEGP